MPITSTKNFRLSSGFGVSNSMWPRWARSKIGSGCMMTSDLDERARHVIEQFVRREGARDQPLLCGIFADQRKRPAHFVRAEPMPRRRRARFAFLQQPGHF